MTEERAQDQLKALPKVELHRHLEGSLRLRTLAEIALEHGIDLPGYDIEDLRPFATVHPTEEPDFHRFLEKFRFLRRFYPTPEAVKRVAYEAVYDAVKDNVRYLELRFNPVALARAQGFSFDEVTQWVCHAVEKAESEHDIRTNLIVQIGRSEDLETASKLLEVAVFYRERGIVGLDLAGDELSYPAHRFAQVFQRAQHEGLHITVHAGEAGGPGNIREAVEQLRAERIGHGIRAIEDSEVIQLLREKEITLEVCPTSNVQTGVVDRFGHHPLPDLMNLDLRVTINTDDPSVSDTTLTDEYRVAMLAMELSMEQIKQAIVAGSEGAFLPPKQRKELTEWFRQELGMVEKQRTHTTGDLNDD